MQEMKERLRNGFPGGIMLLLGLAGLGAAAYFGIEAVRSTTTSGGPPRDPNFKLILAALAWFVVSIWVILKGLISVSPNEAVVLQLFGRYTGTLRKEGLRWINPFYRTRRLSVRARSFCCTKIESSTSPGWP